MIKSKNECIDQAEARALKAENELENLKTEIAIQQKVHDTLKAIQSEIQTSSEGHHKLADKIDELMQNKESDELVGISSLISICCCTHLSFHVWFVFVQETF